MENSQLCIMVPLLVTVRRVVHGRRVRREVLVEGACKTSTKRSSGETAMALNMIGAPRTGRMNASSGPAEDFAPPRFAGTRSRVVAVAELSNAPRSSLAPTLVAVCVLSDDVHDLPDDDRRAAWPVIGSLETPYGSTKTRRNGPIELAAGE